ncbi:MAG: VanZ family protein [Phycisphaerales bacterium]|nr:VanZ family protein [Phycisphaerales bacterium]
MMSRTTRLTWIALLSFWILLFAATHIPGPELPQVNVSDKLIHGSAFFCLGVLLYATFWVRGGKISGIWWKVLLILTLYGAFDEWTQQFVNRFTDVDDWMADTIGVAIAVALMTLVHWARLRLE